MVASAKRDRNRIQYALLAFLLSVSLVGGIGLYRIGVYDDADRKDELFRFYLTLIEVPRNSVKRQEKRTPSRH
jgi:hypothetical protein